MALTKVTSGLISADASSVDLNIDAGTLYIDATNNRVGIGETAPLGKLHIKGNDVGATASAQGNSLILEDTENGLSILSSTAGAGYINFGDSDDNNVGMIVYGHSSNAMNFWTNASNRMTINSAGNVGIGTNSPDDLLHVFAGDSTASASTLSAVNIEKNDDVALTFMTPNTKTAQIRFADPQDTGNGIIAYDHSTAAMTFATNGPEKMRIDSNGCVLVNKTSQTGNAIAGLQIKCGNASSGAYSFAVRNSAESQNALLIENSGVFHSDFIYNTTTSDGANLNISSASVLRRSTSSRRYKTNIRDYDKGIAEIQTLSPKYFNGINDGDTQFAGLIAEDVHDAGLTEFVQYNADNEPDSLAYSHMIALLVKGIQEQQTLIEQLQAEVALLKGE